MRNLALGLLWCQFSCRMRGLLSWGRRGDNPLEQPPSGGVPRGKRLTNARPEGKTCLEVDVFGTPEVTRKMSF